MPRRKDFELKPIRPSIIPQRGTEEYKRFESQVLKYLPRWQNNSKNDLGIVRFGFELFPNTLDRKYGLAGWVAPALAQVLEFKPGWTKMDRAHAICTYREGSKSTWFGKILPLYFTLVGQYGIYWEDYLLPEADYIRMRAKTQEKAEEKLGNITMELQNERILDVFGNLQPSMKQVKTKKYKSQAKFMILLNNYVWQAQGLNMPSRGANIFDKRPKFDLNDDVENKENTKSPQMREYNAKEILGEQFAGLDQQGLTVYIGNIVHQDCILNHLLSPKSGWKSQFHQITYFDGKGREYADWPQRFPIRYVHKLKKFYEAQTLGNSLKIFMMEYYNRILSDADYKIQLFKGRYVREYETNWVELPTVGVDEGSDGGYHISKEKKYVNLHVVVAADPAISGGPRTSSGVVTVVGFGSDGNRYLLDLAYGNFDIDDRVMDESKRAQPLAVTPNELANVYRRGIVQEVVRMILKYHANGWVIEVMGTQRAWFNSVLALLKRIGVRIPGLPYFTGEEKTQKLKFGLMQFFSDGTYYIKDDLSFRRHLETEITSFPETSNDILDGIFNAEQMGRKPPKLFFDRDTIYTPTERKSHEQKRKWKNIDEPYMVF